MFGAFPLPPSAGSGRDTEGRQRIIYSIVQMVGHTEGRRSEGRQREILCPLSDHRVHRDGHCLAYIPS